MRVLLISHWYKPVKSPVKRMARIAEGLADRNDVTVITSLPSYPTGILPQEYRHKLWVTEKDGPIKIVRVWDFPTPNRGFIKRSINHLVFVFSATLASLYLPPADLVIVSSPSFFAGIAGVFASLVGKRNFIFDVRDLWPDSAFELGYHVPVVIKWPLKQLEHWFYRRAKKIFCATAEIRRTIIAMGIAEEKVVTLVNTIDVETFKPLKGYERQGEKRRRIRALYQYSLNDFVIAYVGSLTQVQNLNTVIEAAAMLQKKPRIKFLIVGEGEDKENLIAAAERLRLANIKFIDGQPTEEIVKLVNAADLALISLSKNKFFSDNALPTKTSEYLGCGKPIIACAGKNLKELIETNQVGKVVPTGNAKELAKAIGELFARPALVEEYSRRARQLAVRQFSDANFYRLLKENTAQFFSKSTE